MNASEKAVRRDARAQWLSDLQHAIDEAQWLAWRIGVVEGRNALALELYVRLETVRAEVESIWPRSLAASDLDTLWELASAGERLKE